jgi:uncharacterized protein (DUF4415 family)
MSVRFSSKRPLTDKEEAEIQRMIASDPDNPELTDEEITNLRPAKEVLPPAFFEGIEEARRSRGRPKVASPKVAVTLRIDSDVLEAFQTQGSDWRNRMTDTLRKHMKA